MPFLMTLLLQTTVILVAARTMGWLFRKLRQPQVVGEMTAGILLGPSLLGWLAPGASAVLFPPGSLAYLATLSQVGLLLFMFLVGLELDRRLLQGRERARLAGHASLVVPFLLGAALALVLHPAVAGAGVPLVAFVLFVGVATSVTALPVLARILFERNLLDTPIGKLAVARAARDDVAALATLALVALAVRAAATGTPLWLAFAGAAAYLALMAAGVRPALGRLGTFYRNRGRLTQDMVAIAVVLLLLSAWTTEWLGVHALFGALIMGAAMPRDPGFVQALRGKLEDLTVVFLLPLFFAFTGLRTDVGLLGGAGMALLAGLVLVVAVAGKLGGSLIAGRVSGLSWRESGALGILLNTRGIMGLVILTIGVDLGLLPPALFTMMVVTVLLTTALTTPMLERVHPTVLIREAPSAVPGSDEYTVLLPVSLPGAGPQLLRAAAALVPPGRSARFYGLHLERASERSLTEVEAERLPDREEALRPMLAEAEALGIDVRPLWFTSLDVPRDIVEVAHAKHASLVLLGRHRSVWGRGILSGTVHEVLRDVRADAAVLVARGGAPWRRILIPYRNAREDGGAVEMARRIAANGRADVTILHALSPRPGPGELGRLGASTGSTVFPDGIRLKLVDDPDPLGAAVREAQAGYDLIVVGASQAWGPASPLGPHHDALVRTNDASLLIVRSFEAGRPPGLPEPGVRRASSLAESS